MLRLLRTTGPGAGSRQSRAIAIDAEISARVNDTGAVFLHRGRGAVFSCNAVGARIWQSLRDGRGVSQIAAELAAEYRVPAEITAADASRFVDELEAAGIVKRSWG